MNSFDDEVEIVLESDEEVEIVLESDEEIEIVFEESEDEEIGIVFEESEDEVEIVVEREDIDSFRMEHEKYMEERKKKREERERKYEESRRRHEETMQHIRDLMERIRQMRQMRLPVDVHIKQKDERSIYYSENFIEQETNCCICLDELIDPRPLSCGHTCAHEKCLQTWSIKLGCMECPICRNRVEIV